MRSSCRPGEGLGLAPAARRVYLINCLAALQRPLAQHACAAGRADALGQVAFPGLHFSRAHSVQHTLIRWDISVEPQRAARMGERASGSVLLVGGVRATQSFLSVSLLPWSTPRDLSSTH